MKRQKFEFIEILYYFTVMLSVGMFLMFSLNLYWHRNLLTILSIALLFLMIPILIVNAKRISKSAFIYGTFLSICIIYEISRAKTLYNYSVSNIFLASRQYIWIFLFFVLIYLFKNKQENMRKILDNTLNIFMFSLGIRAFTWFLYTVFQFELFPSILREFGDLWYRNEFSVRIDGTPLIIIGLLISTFFYFKFGNRKYFYYLFLILMYITFVNQTRMLLVSVLISIFLMFVYSRRTSRLLTSLSFITVIIVFVYGGGLDYIKAYLNIDTGSFDMGLGFRYWELKYYLGLLANDVWKLGVGILTSSNINSNFILAGPGAVKMYLDDLGFLELFVQFGVAAIFMYGYIFYKIINLILRMSNDKYRVDRAFFIALLTNLIITSISLNIFGAQRSFSLAIVLALIFYYDYRLKNDIEN